MNKPKRSFPRPLAEFVPACVGEAFARQGFASTALVTHWPDIVGADIAEFAEPIKLQWPRGRPEASPQPGTLVLRVEGPGAIEVQHLAPIIIERVNRFLGWRAVGRIGMRQAPLAQRRARSRSSAPTADETARIAETLPGFSQEALRAALARLGAAIKRA